MFDYSYIVNSFVIIYIQFFCSVVNFIFKGHRISTAATWEVLLMYIMRVTAILLHFWWFKFICVRLLQLCDNVVLLFTSLRRI